MLQLYKRNDVTNVPVRDYAPQGLKYSRYGKRSGVAAGYRDRQIVGQSILNEYETYGSNIASYHAVTDANGTHQLGPQNVNGVMYYPDPVTGTIKILDKDALEHERIKYEEIEERVDEVVKYCLVNDFVCKNVLGDAIFNILMHPDRTHLIEWYYGSQETADAIANPNYLRGVQGTEKYALGLAKLRAVIHNNLPILQSQTPASVLGAEKGAEVGAQQNVAANTRP